MPLIKKAALIGGGVIGGGWAARLLVNGTEVVIYDPSPDAQKTIASTLQNAADAYAKLFSLPHLPMSSPQFVDSIAQAVDGADLVIESVPERITLKQKVYAEIEQAASPSCLITSSTSGLLPSALQEKMKNPERFLVAHPFNPVYLLPLVELVGGKKTDSKTIEKAAAIFSQLGMHPLHVKKEIDAFIADRLLEAVWRESLWLVKEGVATTAEIDDAIRLGFGLRWAQMGLFETYRIAGGAAGIQHFLQQFAPSLKWPWSKLTDVPEMDDDLVTLLAQQSDQQSGAYSIDELSRIRDDNLLAFLQVLQANKWGAGVVQAAWEKQLRLRLKNASENISDVKKKNVDATPDSTSIKDSTKTIRTLSRKVPMHWTDYNGHMNESRYLECFSEASDAILQCIGADENYIAAGHSYFTVDTHLQHCKEIAANQMLVVDSAVLSVEGKKLRLRHVMVNDSGDTIAIGEHLLIHVALATRRAIAPSADILENAQRLASE